ncbi:MAG: 2Fe-2S iron-sulfur cluster binding domain-containing protein [Granulosicoccus sp.]|nr:2Fe-2S iron-sulfur cluster binding domain-containing protein [Granulosicoccus sp.]
MKETEFTDSAVHEVTLQPAGTRFHSVPGRSLLDAGLSRGIALPYGCANGSCGACRARLLHGHVAKFKAHDFTLTEAEKLNGEFLLCSSVADTDCTVEVLEATAAADVPLQQLQAKLCRHDIVDDVHIIEIKFIRGRALRFLPGQRVHLQFTDEFALVLPIASCPCNARSLEFHLSPDILTAPQMQYCIEHLQSSASRTRIQVTGPSGEFTLTNNRTAPIVFIASGGGFARIRGMIEQFINFELDVPFCLVCQPSESTALYQHNLCRSWNDAIDEFDYFPLSTDQHPLGTLSDLWLKRLPSCQIYMDKKNAGLIEELSNLNADPANIFFPDKT